MSEYRFALGTAAATFVLLVIGGLVHATGSSLACPDWPLCYGQFFPPMVGGVLFEHGHRLAALTVVVLTGVLAVRVFRSRGRSGSRALATLALLLLSVQAVLGGLTVLYRLPLLVSTAHLATSMAFFSTVICLAARLRPSSLPRLERRPRALVGLCVLLVYVQIVLGGFVRHTGAAMACSARIPLCDGVFWPTGGPGQLNMLHRYLGLALAALVLLAAWRPAREALRNGHDFRATLALAAPLLVLVQIGLGLLTLATSVSIPVVTVHLATGALLLADLLALFLSLGSPALDRDESSHHRVAGLAPAAG
ncbi:MAG TPA: COX15/CtaA family protein [Anaeromyxobacteraceae bacterium]|nr:COX15/CtaA family protein [Anaeromyxobacteraceae bacterium]